LEKTGIISWNTHETYFSYNMIQKTNKEAIILC
jgi:hypothetical protein